MTQDKQQAAPSGQEEEDLLIQPAGFTPVDPNQVRKKRWLKPLSALLSLLVVLMLAALWYVFSARSVQFEFEPAVQQVNIDGGLHFKVGERYLMRPGAFELRAQREGYHPLIASIEVTKQQNQSFTFSLRKLPGQLQLTSVPAPAEVFIDDTLVGETPLELEVEPGEHSLEMRAARYLPQQERIEVAGLRQRQSYQFELTPNWSRYGISTQPEGATIEVDGVQVATTPAEIELMSGERQVRLLLAGYKSWNQVIQVAANQPQRLPVVTLAKLDGQLHIDSRPSAANVTINGEFKGQTPLALKLAPQKDYQISLFKPGYQVYKQSLSLSSAAQEEVFAQLKPIVAHMKVFTQPNNAKIYVDGQYLGQGNRTLSLPTQRQKLEVKLEGHVTYVSYITPRTDIEQEVRVLLKTLEQAKWEAIKTLIRSPVGDELRLFRPTAFTMGASRREAGRRANESLTKVDLSRAFYLGTKEVSNAQYRKFSAQHSSGHVQGHSLDGDAQPVVKVAWKDAAFYCNWLSEREGLPLVYQVENGEVVGFNQKATGYRLPTEAEWAWAARYSTQGELKYPWGESLPPSGKSGNYADRSAAFVIGRIVTDYDDNYVVTAPVGSFVANQHGLYDMGGNVSEWVGDYYATKSSMINEVLQDPTGPSEGSYRVIRGSSWAHGSVTELRLSYRDYGLDPRNDVGFRIARYVE